MKLIRISKHILPKKTYVCNKCKQFLDVVDITYNPKHFFNPGQEYSCSCGKSKVWTNSVRNIKDLENYCDGKPQLHDVEEFGFCNDKFCPMCWGSFSIIKNGQLKFDGENISSKEIDNLQDQNVNVQELFNKKRIKFVDIHGCERCDNILVHQGSESEGGEYDGQKLTAQWYKTHQDIWRE